MNWWMHIPAVTWVLFVFALGLAVGSFLNVLIARLPLGKTPLWPSQSYCFACRRPLQFRDNLPVLGYLRTGGRCRQCGATFSSRYLWVEVSTAVAFVGLFVVEVLLQATGGPDLLRPWHHAPGLRYTYFSYTSPLPSPVALGYFAYHACFLSLLIACAVIDAEHKVIPHELTYLGVLIGLAGSTLLPWPWPSLDAATLSRIPGGDKWLAPESLAHIPVGATLWPAWVPADSFPAGSWQLGLFNGLAGAAVGTLLVRGVKFLFEYGFGQEAMGLGDADLMMMAGAFLGWPVVVLGFFLGAVLALLLQVPVIVTNLVARRTVWGELPFGPGLALGVVAVWLGWPVAARTAQMLYLLPVLGMGVVVVGGGLLVYGLLRGGRNRVEGGA
jgi:leader peptidase (prepilin peptidase)/N-methyltransferase